MLEKIDASTVRRIQLDTLSKIDELCEQEGLRYCLCGGSLLGAVRHQGFIPWDDDIDILLPRPDYEKFLEASANSIGPRYVTSTFRDNPSHLHPFAKVVDTRTVVKEPGMPDSGVGVDVFPMDGLPTPITASNMQFRMMKVYDALLWSLVSKQASPRLKRLAKRCLKPASRALGPRRILEWMDARAQKYRFDSSDYVAVVVITTYGKRERVSRAAFSAFRRVPFEGREYPIPVGFHEYLSNLYREYMQLPPIERRISHHKSTAHWR